ncbi:hypothetical protein T01_14447 [Trichinella spiralis]|uniref:Uncharacterized protein n=1 Tax=Trichinella spiralis TaxID=6334 RepID=A0A0V0ZDL3_TRISP|nr:hypothetical protein T01_14447 [Trichinella spiralis]
MEVLGGEGGEEDKASQVFPKIGARQGSPGKEVHLWRQPENCICSSGGPFCGAGTGM